MNQSEMYFSKAKEMIPGGVNSPVRSFRSVEMNPLYIERADGAFLYDADGNKYLDYVCSWGPMILGHNHKAIREAVVKAAQNGLSFGANTKSEIRMAELLTTMGHIDMVRMVNSGTEAVMSALRLARGYTKKNIIIKFNGCYHGHSDNMLVQAGSGVLTHSLAASLGVPPSTIQDTKIVDYNDLEGVKNIFSQNKQNVACVIVEPVAANMGVVPPSDIFLQELRRLCDENQSLLIFDEVITGFRLSKGGAQEYYNVKADLVTYGKIIGAGMPVGAYGGRKEIMECVSPLGGVYQAGTLSGNPVAMAAGIAQLEYLNEADIYTNINALGETLAIGLRKIIAKLDLDAYVNQVGSLCCIFLEQGCYADFFKKMLSRGIYLAPSQYEAMFISNVHTHENICWTLQCAEESLRELKREEIKI